MHAVECKINLIMFNPHVGTHFVASSLKRVEVFREVIVQVKTAQNPAPFMLATVNAYSVYVPCLNTRAHKLL